MLKLSISNSIFNAISANLLKGAAAVQHMELTHKELKQALREDLTEKATLRGKKDVEAYIKEEKESRTKRFTRMIEEMNTGSIPSVENNKIRVSSDEDEVTIELKTEFLSDMIDVAGNIFVDGLKSSAETFLHYRRVKGMVKSFAAKWKETPEAEESKPEVKIVPESEVPKEVLKDLEDTSKVANKLVDNFEGAVLGTSFVASNNVILEMPTYVGIGHAVAISEEEVIQILSIKATSNDGKQVYNIFSTDIVKILKAPKVDKDLQQRLGLPFSIMKAVRQAYPTLVQFYVDKCAAKEAK